jgi:hypothetical protein
LPLVSTNTRSIEIKNKDRYPFLKIDLNKITVNPNLIKAEDIGNHTITLRLTSNDNIVNYFNFTLTITKQKIINYN